LNTVIISILLQCERRTSGKENRKEGCNPAFQLLDKLPELQVVFDGDNRYDSKFDAYRWNIEA